MELGHWADERRPKLDAMLKGFPATESERRLSEVINSTFLKLWNFPALYIDKRGHSSGDGKEFCDNLVVFGDRIIIFSDKEIGWKEAKTLDVSWRRWQKAAVEESLKQAAGAWRWLSEHPQRIFHGRRCEKQFFPDNFVPHAARVHVIAVVSGAEQACLKHDPDSKGEMLVGWLHNNNAAVAFTLCSTRIGSVPAHVLDIAGLTKAAREFDTAADFFRYLDWRVSFLEDHHYFSGTESDLIASYLTLKYIASDLLEKSDFSLIITDDYESIRERPEYLRKIEADKISKLWDALIDEVSSHVIGGTVLGPPGQDHFSFHEAEQGMRFLAAPDRFKRRILSEAVIDCLNQLESLKGDRFFRAISRSLTGERSDSPQESDSTFAILVVNAGRNGKRFFESYEEFRVYRSNLLRGYCQGLALRNPAAQPIVGVGLDGCDMGGLKPTGGVDVAVFDRLVFDGGAIDAQEQLEKQLEIFDNVKCTLYKAQEFPDEQPRKVSRQQRRARERRAKKGSAWPPNPATS